MSRTVREEEFRILSVILIFVIAALITLMCIDLIPLMKSVVSHIKNETVISSELRQLGVKGVIILISLGALQIVSAIFPALPIQILSGVTYGVIYGTVISIAGVMLGNALIFVLVRRMKFVFHFSFHPHNKGKKKSKWDFAFLKNSEKIRLMAFLLFLIPGIPNGVLPYLFANTKIKLRHYLLSLAVASVPSVLMNILIGDRLSAGDLTTSLIILGGIAAFSVITIRKRKQIMKYIQSRGNNFSAAKEQENPNE
ncbi:MAG: TVP38/TMEM64 family protein [Anaerofustis sp.]